VHTCRAQEIYAKPASSVDNRPRVRTSPFARSISRSEIDEIDELSENGFRDKTEHGGNTKPLLKSSPDANPND
jgi:hypothetical protein